MRYVALVLALCACGTKKPADTKEVEHYVNAELVPHLRELWAGEHNFKTVRPNVLDDPTSADVLADALEHYSIPWLEQFIANESKVTPPAAMKDIHERMLASAKLRIDVGHQMIAAVRAHDDAAFRKAHATLMDAVESELNHVDAMDIELHKRGIKMGSVGSPPVGPPKPTP